jgi:hypothetical protein
MSSTRIMLCIYLSMSNEQDNVSDKANIENMSNDDDNRGIEEEKKVLT